MTLAEIRKMKIGLEHKILITLSDMLEEFQKTTAIEVQDITIQCISIKDETGETFYYLDEVKVNLGEI